METGDHLNVGNCISVVKATRLHRAPRVRDPQRPEKVHLMRPLAAPPPASGGGGARGAGAGGAAVCAAPAAPAAHDVAVAADPLALVLSQGNKIAIDGEAQPFGELYARCKVRRETS